MNPPNEDNEDTEDNAAAHRAPPAFGGRRV